MCAMSIWKADRVARDLKLSNVSDVSAIGSIERFSFSLQQFLRYAHSRASISEEAPSSLDTVSSLLFRYWLLKKKPEKLVVPGYMKRTMAGCEMTTLEMTRC